MAGATALVPRRFSPELDISPGSGGDAAAPPIVKPRAAGAAAVGWQTSLFGGELSNVIPFESFQRPGARPAAKNEPAANTEVLRDLEPAPSAKQTAEAKHTIKKQSTGRRGGSHLNDTQGSLDLDYLPAAPPASRTLKTTVEASIYCDAEVATPMHRSVAAILDAAMIFIGFGLFVVVFQSLIQYFGGRIAFDRFDNIVFAMCAVLITIVYGMLFAIAGRETAGQNWTELRLINFDGFPPDGRNRALRFGGGWLSFCACGIGVLWCLLDEENLTWHDHMSKTFLTMREGDSPFFRERVR